MKEALQYLVELQRTDERIAIVQRRLDALPAELGERESQHAALEAAAESLEAKRKSALSRAQSLENDVLQLEQRIRKLEQQARNTRDAGAVQVAQHEVGELRNRISSAEEEALQELERGERLAAERVVARERASQAAADLELFRKTVAEDLNLLQAEMAELQQQRSGLLSKVPQALRGQYEKLLPARKGRALAPLRGESCGGCGMVVPPNDRLRAAAFTAVVACRSCSRILVIQELWNGQPSAAETESS